MPQAKTIFKEKILEKITLARVKLLRPLDMNILLAWLKDTTQRGIARQFGGNI
jgi:hypothetical protein